MACSSALRDLRSWIPDGLTLIWPAWSPLTATDKWETATTLISRTILSEEIVTRSIADNPATVAVNGTAYTGRPVRYRCPAIERNRHHGSGVRG